MAMVRVDFSRLRFLVVDDNSYVRRLVRTLLHGFGVHEIVEAEDGAAAIDRFAQANPDILVTDWEMPILDGIELTKLIRTSENSLNPYVPIVMMTAYAEKQRVMQARDAGVTEFLVKPLSAQALHSRVSAIVTNPRPFIRTSTYFGPDRRRMTMPDFAGDERRKGAPAQRTSPHAVGLNSWEDRL
jgi:two-component system chemotaxis response regulator CheY